MTPLLTVITVCRNPGPSLETTIRSVIAQQNVRLEHIIIDGDSSDGTSSLLARYKDFIACIVSEPDQGLYDAMNKGILRARGELLFFLNARDTFVDASVCSRVVAAYQAGQADILYGDIRVVNSQGGLERYVSFAGWDLACFFDVTICHQAVFGSRRAFSECGPFSLDYRLLADLDWELRAMRKKRLPSCYLPFAIANYDNGGISSDPSSEIKLLLDVEKTRALRRHFHPIENFIFRVARRLRLRDVPALWSLLAGVMRWKVTSQVQKTSTASAGVASPPPFHRL